MQIDTITVCGSTAKDTISYFHMKFSTEPIERKKLKKSQPMTWNKL